MRGIGNGQRNHQVLGMETQHIAGCAATDRDPRPATAKPNRTGTSNRTSTPVTMAAATAPDPRRLIAEPGPHAFSRFTLECIRLLQPAQFASIWHSVPTESQKVAYGAPLGIRVDIDNIRDDQKRKSMCRKMNELRQERCFQLSSPSQGDHWHDESWTMTPMSRETCRRFWDLFLAIPRASTNPVKWKATIESSIAQKSLKASPTLHVALTKVHANSTSREVHLHIHAPVMPAHLTSTSDIMIHTPLPPKDCVASPTWPSRLPPPPRQT